MKIKSLLFAFLSFTVANSPSFAQNTQNNTTNTQPKGEQIDFSKIRQGWVTNPYHLKEFIENLGQFDKVVPTTDKILYQAKLGAITANFTSKGVIYRYDEFPGKKGVDPDKVQGKKKSYYVSALWEGGNPNVTVLAKHEQSNYYTYATANRKGTIVAHAYKRIVYKNIYPGIDIIYTFPKGNKEGLKYALIVHPGADLSKAKIKYTGAKNIKIDENGNLLIDGKNMGILTDHAPVSYYKDTKQPVESGFKITNSEASFYTKSIDGTKTLIIDPWVTDPKLNASSYDRAYDLDYDTAGNVYVYGGYNYFELSKINGSTGALLWTYTANTIQGQYYGDVACDHPTGTCYLVEGLYSNGVGASVVKIRSNGNYVGQFAGDPTMLEMWRACSNPCNRNIVIGGGGTNSPAPYNAFVLDTSLTKIAAINTSNAPDPGHDVVLEALDPNGTNCYMAVPTSTFGPSPANEIIKSPLPNLSPNVWVTSPDNFGFGEVAQPYYIGPGNSFPTDGNGMNGMAVSPNWLYAYNGDTLRQFNKNTGAMVKQLHVSTGNTLYTWGGLDADVLDNVYLGYNDSIYIYNSALVKQSGFKVPNTNYDLVIDPPVTAFTCGAGFVTKFSIPHIKLISATTGAPSSCKACDGKATVTGLLGGLQPYTYKWSNGETGQTDSDLCVGIYTITVKDASCPPLVDSAVVTITGEPGYTASLTDTNPGCIYPKGTITAFPTGGNSPYTYTWSNGQTTQEATGLTAGVYTLTVTDANGCKYIILDTLYNVTPVPIFATPALDSVCSGIPVNLKVTGLKNYTWAPGASLSCQNCPNPVATPTVTTVYTVTATDSNGCTSSATVTIKIIPGPKIVITPPKDSLCAGNSVVLSATGAGSYTWTPSNSLSCNNCPNPTATPTVTTTYTVSGSNGGCSGDTTITIKVGNGSATITPPQNLCAGGSVILSAGGGGTYLWSNGASTSSISVSPDSNASYKVVVNNGGCLDSVSTFITVENPNLIACCNDTIIRGDTVTIHASGQNNYSWFPPDGLSCSNCPNPIASPSVTTTYTVTSVDSNDCTVSRVITIYVEVPCADFKTPNVFTPNNDGINDDFVVTVLNSTSYSIVIYDRWGKEVYSSNDVTKYWNGRYNNTDYLVPDGVYYYIIKATCGDNNYTKKGFVQVLGESK